MDLFLHGACFIEKITLDRSLSYFFPPPQTPRNAACNHATPYGPASVGFRGGEGRKWGDLEPRDLGLYRGNIGGLYGGYVEVIWDI